MPCKSMLVLALLATTAAAAPAQNAWRWHKVVPAGKAVEIKGVIGDITATPASGSEVEVVAHKIGRSRDTSSVEIQVVEHSDGVTICAIYEDDNECLPGAGGHSSSHDNDTEVNFEVRVPRGVLLTAHTVVGRVDATGMTADVDASTVTGDVRVSTTGLAYASSVSGSLELAMGRADWTGTLSYSTVSGDITLEFADALNAEVTLSTVSGELSSDWPVSLSTSSSRRLAGTIGTGGRHLRLSTVSGDVELRKKP